VAQILALREYLDTVRSTKKDDAVSRVREILSWYGSDNPGTLTHLARMLNHGRLAGSGKMVILPVDQGFEHGPARSFAPNPLAYDPHYHYKLAIKSGCNAYAAPLGFLEAGARDFAGEVPLILKVNDHDVLHGEEDPTQTLTGSVADALRLGCVGIGFTIYPGSTHRLEMYSQIRAYAEEAKRYGLAVIIWSYPRGSGSSKAGETGIDVTAYAARLAAQLGAHITKSKPLASTLNKRRHARSTRGARSPCTHSQSAYDMWSSRASMADVSSSSPAAQPQGLTKCLVKSGQFVRVAALARLLDVTPSSAPSPTRCNFSVLS